jgi:hypothetical protein
MARRLSTLLLLPALTLAPLLLLPAPITAPFTAQPQPGRTAAAPLGAASRTSRALRRELGFRFHLPDPFYAQRAPAPQARPVPGAIRWLAHPSPGAPALARAGGRLSIRVAVALPHRRPWVGLRVTLHTRLAGHRWSTMLPVEEVRRAAAATGTLATGTAAHATTPAQSSGPPTLTELTCTVPASTPRESYDLTVRLPDGRQATHRRAVRVLHRSTGPRRIVVVADHQLWDPSAHLLRGARHAAAFPRRDARHDHEAVARQGRHELDLLDPDLVLHLGDLIFGLDYSKEYPEALALWQGPSAARDAGASSSGASASGGSASGGASANGSGGSASGGTSANGSGGSASGGASANGSGGSASGGANANGSGGSGSGRYNAPGPATFFVPGNHDAYARYGLNLKASLPKLAVGMVRCRKHLPRRPHRQWRRLWKFLTCVYGDLRPVLFSRLLSDGLAAYRRTLGPSHYAFELGRTRFIALNTYDGTPERRHAYSLWVDIRGLHLGAPLVDNYGGYLSVAQLRWLQRQARAAAARGQRLVVLGHHDPRGNPTGAAYHPNQAFPTDPVGPDHFEAWNYDGAWDSNPADSRARETAVRHSGHALLRVLARHGGVYLTGHVHRDRRHRYPADTPIRDGIVAHRPVTFLKVTTASAAPKRGGYWGYRLLTLHPDGALDTAPFSKNPALPSVPAGNLWATPGQGAGEVATLHTGLPRAVTVRLRAVLPHRPRGYRFDAGPAAVRLLDVAPLASASAPAASPAPMASRSTAAPSSPASSRNTSRKTSRKTSRQTVYYLQVRLPAAGPRVARSAAEIQRFAVRAEPAARNRPPGAFLQVDGRDVKSGATHRVSADTPVTVEVRGVDPDGHRLLPPLIADPRGRGARARRANLRFREPGAHRVTVTLRDELGAPSTTHVTLRVTRGATHPDTSPETGDPDETTGTGCASHARLVAIAALALVLLGIALILAGRRRHNR